MARNERMADYDGNLVERTLTPDELCTELGKDFETLEITEDETETLLQEALALNKRLKAELRRQSHPDGGGTGLASSLDSSPLAAKPPRHGGKGARTLLPPIRSDKRSSGATSSSKKSKTGKKMAAERTSLSAGSTARKLSAGKGRPRGSKSADNRPQWNDRFSYSD